MTDTDSQFLWKEACPKCGSTNNLARYDDGHAHCFGMGCDYYEPADGEFSGKTRQPQRNTKMADMIEGNVRPLKARGIDEETCRKYNYRVGKYRGEAVHIAPLSLPNRGVVSQQIRTKEKDFPILGDFSEKPFFGMSLWNGGLKVVVTEGHIDALTVSQVQGNKYPVLSVPNGADGAKKAFAKHLDYFANFDEIILMFDNDEAGQKAAQDCAPLFPVGKCKIATIPNYKDANEALLAGATDEIIKAIWNAKEYKPHGIVSGHDVLERGDPPITWGLSWPFPSVTAATYGIRPNEMYAIGSGTGCGKTDLLKTVAAHIVTEHKEKCLMFLLEEPNQTLTMDTIAGKIDETLYHIPDMEYDAEKKAATKRMLADYLYMYDVGNGVEVDDILELIRYAVAGMEVRHVFLDHITYLMDMVGEREQLAVLKRLMRGLNDLNKEFPFTLYYVSHLRKSSGDSHEEGGRISLDDFAGGKANVQYANFTFALERDQQAEDDSVKNETTLRILKDRYTGHSTGQTITLRYNPKNGTKQEVDPFADEDGPVQQPEATDPF